MTGTEFTPPPDDLKLLDRLPAQVRAAVLATFTGRSEDRHDNDPLTAVRWFALMPDGALHSPVQEGIWHEYRPGVNVTTLCAPSHPVTCSCGFSAYQYGITEALVNACVTDIITPGHMDLGAAWPGHTADYVLATVALSGQLTRFDPPTPRRPIQESVRAERLRLDGPLWVPHRFTFTQLARITTDHPDAQPIALDGYVHEQLWRTHGLARRSHAWIAADLHRRALQLAPAVRYVPPPLLNRWQ